MSFRELYFPDTGLHVAFICHVSLVSFNLEQFFRLTFTFTMLILLMSTGFVDFLQVVL